MSAPPPEAPPDADIGARFIRGVAWTTLERWFVRALGLVSFAVLARVLAPADIGLVALAASFVAVVTIVAEAGLTTHLVQENQLTQRMLATSFWIALGLAAVGAGVLMLSAPLWAKLFGEPRLLPVLSILSLSLFGAGLSAVPTALFQRAMRFGPLAARQAISAGVAAAVGITLAVLGAGIWSLVAQSLVFAAVGTSVLWIASPWRPSLQFGRREADTALRYGGKVMGANMLTTVRDQGEYLLIGGILGPAALGYWAVASRLLAVLVELGVSVVSSVATPAFALIRDNKVRLARAYGRATSASAMVVLPMLTILSITSTEVVPLIYGEKWARSGEVASILTLMALFALLVNFDRAVYFAVGRPGVELTLVLFIVASHLAVVAIFAPMGLTVLAVALLARSALTWPVRVLALRRVAGMTWSAYSGVALALFGSASTGVLLLTLRSYVFKDGNVADLAFTVTIGLAAYASLMSLVSREFRALVVRALGATRRASSGVTK